MCSGRHEVILITYKCYWFSPFICFSPYCLVLFVSENCYTFHHSFYFSTYYSVLVLFLTNICLCTMCTCMQSPRESEKKMCLSHCESFNKMPWGPNIISELPCDTYPHIILIFSTLSSSPQVLCFQTKIHQKWMLFVPLHLDLPDHSVTMRGLEKGRGPRKYCKI